MKSIRLLSCLLAFTGAVAVAAPLSAAPAKKDPKAVAAGKTESAGKTEGAGKPTLTASFGDWGAYAAAAGKAKTCYALGQPKDRQPAKLKRDPGYVFISTRPAESVRNEVSIAMGFDVKPDSAPSVEINGANYNMVAKGANLWYANPADEPKFVDALRKGARLVVKASSRKGNVTTDSYSLSGLAQALDRTQKDCQ